MRIMFESCDEVSNCQLVILLFISLLLNKCIEHSEIAYSQLSYEQNSKQVTFKTLNKLQRKILYEQFDSLFSLVDMNSETATQPFTSYLQSNIDTVMQNSL